MLRTTALSESNLWTQWSITQVPLSETEALLSPTAVSLLAKRPQLSWRGCLCWGRQRHSRASHITSPKNPAPNPPEETEGSSSLPEFGVFQVLILRALPLNLLHTIFFLKTVSWGPSWWAFSLEREGQKGALPKFLKKKIINLLSLYLLSKKHSWFSCFLLSIICSLPITTCSSLQWKNVLLTSLIQTLYSVLIITFFLEALIPDFLSS